jgi:hypothetical protein
MRRVRKKRRRISLCKNALCSKPHDNFKMYSTRLGHVFRYGLDSNVSGSNQVACIFGTVRKCRFRSYEI